ncbi:PAS domain-containing protein [Methylobacterium oryzisoli]|uniref:PAS domain-containing protein n=1 Tax=Methylobacterium oryzisoli TaxID=3385502 RepID=UPI0038918D5A
MPGGASSQFDILRMIEGFGLAGYWTWEFESDRQIWSPGLRSLLGRTEPDAPPDYDRFLRLVHPEDRDWLDAPTLVRAGTLGQHRFRIIRPNGTLRVVESRGEVLHHGDGRPRGAIGVVLDVTDREHALRAARFHAAREHALAVTGSAFGFAALHGEVLDLPEWRALTGLARATIDQGWSRPGDPEDLALPPPVAAAIAARRPYRYSFTARLPAGETVRFFECGAPVLGEDRGGDEWAGLVVPWPVADVSDRRTDPDSLIRGREIRAARALLAWTLTDLAEASELSLSTVRRLEEESDAASHRSRRAVLDALRSAGVVFTLVKGEAVAVALGR